MLKPSKRIVERIDEVDATSSARTRPASHRGEIAGEEREYLHAGSGLLVRRESGTDYVLGLMEVPPGG
ncbi:hypothetical protein [Lentzea guizhouensis]|uniref:hypothetical protein n=1 Tax=Lentzea guizhouensis TaxID=1586287 RepID=UPI0012B694A4|nr:hypothetical protein [Lentzea guizhouensis]